jgi:hypothetical protein
VNRRAVESRPLRARALLSVSCEAPEALVKKGNAGRLCSRSTKLLRSCNSPMQSCRPSSSRAACLRSTTIGACTSSRSPSWQTRPFLAAPIRVIGPVDPTGTGAAAVRGEAPFAMGDGSGKFPLLAHWHDGGPRRVFSMGRFITARGGGPPGPARRLVGDSGSWPAGPGRLVGIRSRERRQAVYRES